MIKRKCPHCGADLVNFCGVWICPYDCEETEELESALDFPEVLDAVPFALSD